MCMSACAVGAYDRSRAVSTHTAAQSRAVSPAPPPGRPRCCHRRNGRNGQQWEECVGISSMDHCRREDEIGKYGGIGRYGVKGRSYAIAPWSYGSMVHSSMLHAAFPRYTNLGSEVQKCSVEHKAMRRAPWTMA